MILRASDLALMAGRKENANMASIVAGLRAMPMNQIELPHRAAHYLAQLGHESGGFYYDREIWGPTPAQSRYDTRTDLGNTAARDGDGKLYMGRTATQITGKANYTAFTLWVRQHIDPKAPDFVKNPELINTDPYEGLVPIWYWTTRNLNALADVNDITQITYRINGGYNGFGDRKDWYTRCGLVLAGFGPTDVKGFQRSAKILVDGLAGPATRTAIHTKLTTLNGVCHV